MRQRRTRSAEGLVTGRLGDRETARQMAVALARLRSAVTVAALRRAISRDRCRHKVRVAAVRPASASRWAMIDGRCSVDDLGERLTGRGGVCDGRWSMTVAASLTLVQAARSSRVETGDDPRPLQAVAGLGQAAMRTWGERRVPRGRLCRVWCAIPAARRRPRCGCEHRRIAGFGGPSSSLRGQLRWRRQRPPSPYRVPCAVRAAGWLAAGSMWQVGKRRARRATVGRLGDAVRVDGDQNPVSRPERRAGAQNKLGIMPLILSFRAPALP